VIPVAQIAKKRAEKKVKNLNQSAERTNIVYKQFLSLQGKLFAKDLKVFCDSGSSDDLIHIFDMSSFISSHLFLNIFRFIFEQGFLPMDAAPLMIETHIKCFSDAADIALEELKAKNK